MIQLRIEQITKTLWQCTLLEWDLHVPFGYGNSIQEAIEDYFSNFDVTPKYSWI